MFQKIDIQTAEELLSKPEAVLLDIRDGESFINGHHGKAIHLTQGSLSSVLENTDKDAPILVMCYHGNSSQSVAAYFSEQGFSSVYSIDGGYEAWVNSNLS